MSPEGGRLLSSRATPLYKYGGVGFALLFVAMVLPLFLTDPDPAMIAFMGLPFGVVVAMAVMFGRIRTVELVGDRLVVSARGGPVEIPLQDIESVGGSRFSNPDRIWLDLRRPTEIGSRIHFLPPLRWFHFGTQHPLVAELAARIEHHAAPGRPLFAAPEPWSWGARIAVGVVAFVGLVGLLTTVVFGFIRESVPYQRALAVVEIHPEALRVLGEPVEAGWYVLGSLETGRDHGHAELAIPVSGSRAEGTLSVFAWREEGDWTFEELELEAEGRTIDLLEP